MTDIEVRVRELLHDMAAESRPAPLLATMRQRGAARRHRRRRIAARLAAAAVVAAVVSGLLLTRPDRSVTPAPAEHPPKTFRVTTTSSLHPGVARMTVTLGGGRVTHEESTPAYILPTGTDGVVTVPPSGLFVFQQTLSADGRVLLRLARSLEGPDITLTDLATGHERQLPNRSAAYGALSPDGKTLALRDDEQVTLVDVASGRTRPLLRLSPAGHPIGNVTGTQVGWSPDGRLLAVPAIKNHMLIVDQLGRLKARIAGLSLVNGSMSWSPDGHSILTYSRSRSSFQVVPAGGGEGQVLRRPPDARQLLGWAGQESSGCPGKRGRSCSSPPTTWVEDCGPGYVSTSGAGRSKASRGRAP